MPCPHRPAIPLVPEKLHRHELHVLGAHIVRREEAEKRRAFCRGLYRRQPLQLAADAGATIFTGDSGLLQRARDYGRNGSQLRGPRAGAFRPAEARRVCVEAVVVISHLAWSNQQRSDTYEEGKNQLSRNPLQIIGLVDPS